MTTIEVIADLEEFYPTLEKWWTGHGWPPVPKAILPMLGVRAMDGTRPIAASFLYQDNSVGVAMMEWTVADPEAKPRQVATAILRIADFLKQEATALNYSVILTTCRQESLAKLLGRAGYQETDREMIHLATTL